MFLSILVLVEEADESGQYVINEIQSILEELREFEGNHLFQDVDQAILDSQILKGSCEILKKCTHSLPSAAASKYDPVEFTSKLVS